MRQIDADALKKEFCKDIMGGLNWERIIDNAPTVEDRTREVLSLQETIRKLTVEKPQGEWKRDNYGDVFCSNCGVECAYNEEGLYSLGRFCHHCGADMRGEEE